MIEPQARQKARELLAQSFEALGPAYANLAGLIRSPGYESFWITPALDAMCLLVVMCPDADEDEPAV